MLVIMAPYVFGAQSEKSDTEDFIGGARVSDNSVEGPHRVGEPVGLNLRACGLEFDCMDPNTRLVSYGR